MGETMLAMLEKNGDGGASLFSWPLAVDVLLSSYCCHIIKWLVGDRLKIQKKSFVETGFLIALLVLEKYQRFLSWKILENCYFSAKYLSKIFPKKL